MHYHKPVLLQEIIEHLNIKSGDKVIDATLGDAGHTIEFLKAGAHVLGIDIFNEGLKRATNRIEKEGLSKDFVSACGNFKEIDSIAKQNNFENVQAILMDLGYSSTQLESDDIGLSFMQDQPLDMRLDSNLGVTAADLVNVLPEKDLATIFRDYADERYAKRFAKAIIENRNLEKFQTTKQLAKVIVDAAPPGYEQGRIHPATRVFQALRIVVNDEVENLKISLPRAASLLCSSKEQAQSKLPGGRMAVISFHSLEDRVVKQFGRSMRPQLKEITKKPIVPLLGEVQENPRSRSAKLRIYERN